VKDHLDVQVHSLSCWLLAHSEGPARHSTLRLSSNTRPAFPALKVAWKPLARQRKAGGG